MLEIKATDINNLNCYLLTIRKKYFLSISKPELSNLKNFNNIHTTNSQHFIRKNINKSEASSSGDNYENTNKIEEEIIEDNVKTEAKDAEKDFSRLKIHLDLNYIKEILSFVNSHPNCSTLSIIITDYQQFLILPYIVKRLHPQKEIKIFTTHIAYEIGKIYLKEFFTKITRFDLIQSHPCELSYDEESRLEDEFYVKFGVDIRTWTKLFTLEDMNLSLSMVHKMNYGEIYDADGVSLSPIPSGYSLGSCCWMFENLLTKETILFVREISSQKWRSIAQHWFVENSESGEEKETFKEKTFKNVDLLVLANSSIITQTKEKPEIDIQMLLHKISVNLEKGLNTEVILDDELLILDIIDTLSFELKDKFKGIFISHPQFSQIVSYANSYVEFLSQGYKDRIFQDPPQYPFDSYMILKQRGFLFTGSLYEISEKEKVPLKELLRRAQPYVHFRSQLDEYLENTEPEKDRENLPSTLSYQQSSHFPSTELLSLLQSINPKKTISYTNILSYIDSSLHQNIAILTHNKHFTINSNPNHHYLSKNISPNIINKYEFVDGFIMAYPVNREFLRLNSVWKMEIEKHLKGMYRAVLESEPNVVRTKCSELKIEDYEITIKTSDPNELLQILQILSAITKTLRLK